jgi:hypothetical protein
MVSRKAKKEHPWRQGYQAQAFASRDNRSWLESALQRYNNSKRGHFYRALTDEQEEQRKTNN